MYSSQRFYETSGRVTQLLVLVYQALAIIVFIGGLYFSYDWLKNPFIGGLFEHTYVLNGSNTLDVDEHNWPLYAQGFKQGDQLISVNGQQINSSNDLKNILSSTVVGQTVTVVMKTSKGDTKTTTVTL